MNKKDIRDRLAEIERYLNKRWKGMSDHFTERLLARAEYDKLLKQLYD